MTIKVPSRLLAASLGGVSVAVMDDATIGRRVAAARKRAGIDQRKTLTDAAELPRVGPATLGKIERGERHLYPHEADVFAAVLGVDRSFFYEDDAPGDLTKFEILEANQAEIMRHLARLEKTVADLVRALGVSPGEPVEGPEIPRFPARRHGEDQIPDVGGQQ